MKKILFTGGGGVGNEAILRLLSSKYDLYFADCNVNNIDPDINSDQRIEIPVASDPNFVDSLIKVTKALRIDILVPGVDEELILLSDNRELFDCQIFAPDFEFVKGMLDKYLCMNSIKKAGLSAPLTYQVNDWNLLNFPMIIKPKSGRGSRGVMIVNSKEEIDAYRVFNKFKDSELIVQELLIGQEYTVMVSADNEKKINSIIPIKVAQKKGITITAVLEMNELIIDYVNKFHEKFSTRCIYNIQCIVTGSGQIFPFEINPRISTTFCMTLAAGFDPFDQYGKKTVEIFEPKKTIRLARMWKNYISS